MELAVQTLHDAFELEKSSLGGTSLNGPNLRE